MAEQAGLGLINHLYDDQPGIYGIAIGVNGEICLPVYPVRRAGDTDRAGAIVHRPWRMVIAGRTRADLRRSAIFFIGFHGTISGFFESRIR